MTITQDIRIEEIMKMIPHRYPLLLVDRMLEVTPDYAIGLKNITMNEAIFQGHFPTQPIMPGVLLIESMAQTAAAYVVTNLGEDAMGKLVYFMSISDARFRKPVVPGDQVLLHIRKVRERGPVWKFAAEAKVNDVLVAQANFSAMITDKE
ncbi:MAG: 3-hydroxyacyl-ACP dehydratase FabZ [Alphaproteobacteria bacterium]